MSTLRTQWIEEEEEEEEEVAIVENKSDNGKSKKAIERSLRVQLLLWINRMINWCKDLTIMLLVAFTYAALMNEPPKITKTPTAYRFFPNNSTVHDYFHGEINLAIEYARMANIAFIMFYAPWDAESQTVRKPFEEAATTLMKNSQQKVTFAAVNCWQPNGECRRQYNKVYKWPVLIAYVAHTSGVQYNGPYETNHFIRFLQAIAKPFVRITNEVELNDLIANNDAAVVVYIDASPGQHDYAVLYTVALKMLERDPFQEVAFAVCTVAKYNRPVLELHMWNESLVYPEENNWLSEQIIDWIFKQLHQITLWYHPSGMKSKQMSNYLQPGPTLILFTPNIPLLPHSDMYDMFREISLEYYNCNNVWRVTNTQIWLRKTRIKNYIKYKEMCQKCEMFTQNSAPSITVTYSKKKWNNLTRSEVDSFCRNSFDVTCRKLSNNNCFNNHADNDETFFVQQLHKEKHVDGDLKRLWEEENCKLFQISQNYYPAIYSQSTIDYVNNRKSDLSTFNITGLSCKTNASLSFIAIDSLLYYPFAERLGINIGKRNKEDKTFAVIVNDKQEMHHILDGPINDFTLKQFIYNFTTSNINRALDNPKVKISSCVQGDVCIKELNTEMFLSTVMQQRKAVLVLYYSKQCFFCHGISHIFLTISHLLRNTIFMEFTRIDGDSNNLSWEYTMEKYPTILFFPMYKKSESRVFPRNMNITLQNLVNFILTHIDGNFKLSVMYTLCKQKKFSDEIEECTKDIRLEILNLIELNLKYWRKAIGIGKAAILRRLNLLKRLHLVMGCTSKQEKEISFLLQSIENS